MEIHITHVLYCLNATLMIAALLFIASKYDRRYQEIFKLQSRSNEGQPTTVSSNFRSSFSLLHQQDDVAISMIFSTILIVTSEEVRHGLTLLPLPPGGEDAPMA